MAYVDQFRTPADVTEGIAYLDSLIEAAHEREREALWDEAPRRLRAARSDLTALTFAREAAERLRFACERDPAYFDKLRATLGFRSNSGWLTATACVLVGIGIGNFSNEVDDSDSARLAALEENITLLNRRLILDRLEDQAPGTRLRGVIDAASYAGNDSEIANALLERATRDRVASVRSAAIDALGSTRNVAVLGEQFMQLLERAESPIVQFALVDLVLRYGNKEQIDQLLTLAGEDRLHPDLARHVIASVQGDTA